jgi:hypothetical protein
MFMSFFRSIIQNVMADPVNSSTSNITAGATWNSDSTGSSTLGVAGIQTNVYMSQNGIVYIDQSMDQIHWDIVDSFNYYTTLGGNSWTTQATASYTRVRVKNVGTVDASNVRIQTALCPIVEAVPRALDYEGNLKVGVEHIFGGNFDKEVKVSPGGAFKTASATRLIGANFAGTTLDTNFWVSTPTSGGTATQASQEMVLATNTTSNAAILLQSVRTARYVPSYSNYLRCACRLPAVTTSVGTNTRRWGAYDATSGFFFEANQGTGVSTPTLSLVCRFNTSDANKINTGSFNGDQGATFILDNNIHTYEIYWTTSFAWFFIDDVLIHKFSGTVTPLVDAFSLKASAECINAGTNTANNTLVIRSLTINRFGELITQPQYKYQSGTTTGIICKYGPGNLHTVFITAQALNSAVTIYDGVSTGGTVMFASTSTAAVNNTSPSTFDFKGVPFSTGLFLVIGTASSNVTLIYE